MVSLKIYDILGKEVATLVNDEKPTGSYKVEFDGNKLASGIYLYKLTASGGEGSFTETKKLVLLK
jgi:type IX secretion system substrate protein